MLQTLRDTRLLSIIADFERIRIDRFYQHLNQIQGKGRILPFVRGLRLSARLIYVIREELENSGLNANWGHILNEDETLCSAECDIIIHKGSSLMKWNEFKEPIMDFRFIERENAIAVISCKSFLETSKIELNYPNELRDYVEKVWLFVECCRPGAITNIQTRSLESGYEHFWYLYTWDKRNQIVGKPNSEGWLNFIKQLRIIKQDFGTF